LQIGVWSRRCNKEICCLFNDFDIIKRIKNNRLRWSGLVIRRENEEIIKLMLVKLEGKKKKGRPRMRRMDGVEKDLRKTKAREQDGWRKFFRAGQDP
jgi:hypothetical protein